MERQDIIKRINVLALSGAFDEVTFFFVDQDYTVAVCGYDCGATIVDISYFPDFDYDVNINMFNDEFLRAFYRAVCEKTKLTDKNLF